MKPYPAFLAFVGVLALALQYGCNKQPGPPVAADAPAAPAGGDADAGDALRVMGTVPPFGLTDQSGAAFDSGSLQGKVWVANFFFTRCQSTCPQQSGQVRALQDAKLGGDTAFLSISVQPEVDTPEVLTRYAQQYGADPARWHFLTGEREAIWELSRKHFFLPVDEAESDADMPIFHSAKLILVDQLGQIRGFFDSQSPGTVAALRGHIKTLLENPPQVAQTAERTGAAQAQADLADLEKDAQGAFNPKPATTGEAPVIYAPSKSRVLAPWMLDRGDRQRDTRGKFAVFHNFQFVDKLPESGIDFMNQVVEDAGKRYTAAHYDHGNGVAIADIDNDGRYDIYFTNQIGANGLFRNLGQGKFANITQQAGVGLEDRISVTASFADFDNDGDADLFVTTVRHGNALFRNDGQGNFADVTDAMGLAYKGHSSASVFFDYDRDGWLDLFVTNVGKYTTEEVGVGNYYLARPDAFAGHLRPELNETCRLYRNVEGTKFEDVTQAAGLEDDSWSGAATPLDANADGWPDLYVLSMQGHDEYFENVGGKRFEKKSRALFPKTSWGAMGVKVFDYNGDGELDIYITDMHSDMSENVDIDREKDKANMQWAESMLQSGGNSIWGNTLFERQADGSYKEVSDAVGAENYWPWGLSVGDLNADGHLDVFIASSMNLPFRYAVNSLLLNNQGKQFLDSEFILGVEPRRDGRTSKLWFTLDCDGPDKEHSYAKEYGITSGKAEVWAALGSRASVIFDLDNDGDLDIVTNDFHSEPLVLESNLSDQKPVHFLKVRLVGKKSNRDGLGAIVELKSGGRTYTQVHDGQSGYLSQSSQLLYFGLGDAQQVDAITVTWPSGTKQVLENVEAINRVLTITESE